MDVGICYRQWIGTPFDVLLIDALLADGAVSSLSLWCRRESTGSARRNGLFDRLQWTLARAEHNGIDLRTLAAARPALSLAEGEQPPLSVVIDFSGGDWTSSTESARVLTLWSDGVSADLAYRFPSARSVMPRAGAKLEVTLTAPDGSSRVMESSNLPSISPYPAYDRRNALARSVSLLVRSVRKLSMGEPPGEEQFRMECDDRSTKRSALAFAQTAASALGRYFSGKPPEDDWFLAYTTDGQSLVSETAAAKPGRLKTLVAPRGRYYADPCVFVKNTKTYIFFEEYDRAVRRGSIVCSTDLEDGRGAPPSVVLKESHHLSYPFVFEHDGKVFMIPESADNGTVDLYSAESFPGGWQHRATLLSGINAADATVYHDGKLWWMFAAVGEFGAAPWDELSLFFADRLEGPWSPHPQNPVKCDAASSRPAGALFVRDGKLIRPAQDCSRVYGGGVTLCEVETLTTTAFRERIYGRLDPSLIPGAKGLHTLSTSAAIEVIDARL